jgi:hypothetical protein
MPQVSRRLRCNRCGGKQINTRPAWHVARRPAFPTFDPMKSRDEQLTWAKHRALICVDMGGFADAVAGLRADLDLNPLTKGLMSSDQALRGYGAQGGCGARGSQTGCCSPRSGAAGDRRDGA